MTENISIKIKKLNQKITDNYNDKYALYEIEPADYDSHSYSWLKIEYVNDSDLEKKRLKLKLTRLE